jgi:hypothetical protein
MLAIEPPLTKSPPAPFGRPHASRSQSTVTSSIWAGPDASNQVPAKTLNPATGASAMTPMKLLGPGTKAKKRGWSTCMILSKTSLST